MLYVVCAKPAFLIILLLQYANLRCPILVFLSYIDSQSSVLLHKPARGPSKTTSLGQGLLNERVVWVFIHTLFQYF